MKLTGLSLLALLFAAPLGAVGQDDPETQAEKLKATAAWKQLIEAKLARDPRLKALSDRYGYHFIHSKLNAQNDSFDWCAFSFTHLTGDESKHQGDVHLIYHQSNAKTMDVNPRVTCSNQIMDLGKVDFLKDVNPRSVDIAGERGWSSSAKAEEGHVYLIRVKDDAGSRYFVMMQVIHVDPAGDWIAFISRRVDGRPFGLPEDKVVNRSAPRP